MHTDAKKDFVHLVETQRPAWQSGGIWRAGCWEGKHLDCQREPYDVFKASWVSIIIQDSSSEVSTSVRPWERGNNVKALFFHYACNVVLVTQYDISCFPSIICSALDIYCPHPHSPHPLWVAALFIFTINAWFCNTWPVCSLKPDILRSCVSLEMHLSQYDTWRKLTEREQQRSEDREIQRGRHTEGNLVVVSNLYEESLGS